MIEYSIYALFCSLFMILHWSLLVLGYAVALGRVTVDIDGEVSLLKMKTSN
jgi:hypothetical protein